MSDERARLFERVRAWIDDDPDPACRAELEALVASSDEVALRARFDAPLGFGTAGLRGPMGAGPARMNRAVLARTTAALCTELVRAVTDATRRGICIGHDARHHSAEFANEAAAVAMGAGFHVHRFGEAVPTPLLAFAVRDRGAAAGVMITASHNPAADNGCKVYWDDGAQVLPPHDAAVAASAATTVVRTLARCTLVEARARGLEHLLDASLRERYLAAIAPPPSTEARACARALRIAYTALHGVGESLAREALARTGFVDVHSVSAQATPDPDFPTARAPNPEEPGAMSLVLALADAADTRADLVLANDPDADRLAVAARDAHGVLRRFSGNEIGVLLADHLLERDTGSGAPLVIGTVVSTPLVDAIARERGALHATTLTGFKWIMRRAAELERTQGARLVLGFEEALGYAVSRSVHDKDGISAAVAVATLAATEKARGRTLVDRLRDLWRRHGVYVSGQVTLVLDASQVAAIGTRARTAPPTTLAGLRVRSTLDLESGLRRIGDTTEPVGLPRSDVLVWELEGGHRIALRPSGTEPKVKLYLDVCEAVHPSEDITAAEARAHATLERLRSDAAAWLGT